MSLLFTGFEYEWVGEQFDRNIPRELDFCQEAENCERCGRCFADEPQITTPSVRWKRTSGRVLTMSFEEGVSVTELPRIQAQGLDLREVARLLSTAFARQIFRDGFVHCDPHPGNVFVRERDGKAQLVLLDHGLYAELDEQTRFDYAMLWRGLLTQDEELIRVHSRCLGTDLH